MNKKENIKKFSSAIIALFLGLVIVSVVNYVSALTNSFPPTFSPPNCPTSEPECNLPISTGSTNQVKLGSLSVNSLVVNAGAQIKTLIGLGGNSQTCVSATGVIEPCVVTGGTTTLSPAVEIPDTLSQDTFGMGLSPDPNKYDTSIPNGPSSGGIYLRKSGTHFCPSPQDSWNYIDWMRLDTQSITNNSSVAKNYLIIASMSVTNDGGADYPILMLKEGSVASPLTSLSGNILAYKQITTDNNDYWRAWAKQASWFTSSDVNYGTQGMPSLAQITYTYTIPANETRTFSTWTTETADGCYNIIGGLLQITPMNPTDPTPSLKTIGGTITAIPSKTCPTGQSLDISGNCVTTPVTLTCTLPNQILNSTGTACVCNTGYTMSGNTCVANIVIPTCYYPQVLNSTKTACISGCPSGQVLDSTKTVCIIPALTCTSPLVLNSSGTACVARTCTSPQVLSSDGLSCVTPSSNSYTWYKAGVGQTCGAYCSSIGKSCVVNTQSCSADQTALSSTGVSCSSYTYDPGQSAVPQFNGSNCTVRTSSWVSCSTDQITSTSCSSSRNYWSMLCSCQ